MLPTSSSPSTPTSERYRTERRLFNWSSHYLAGYLASNLNGHPSRSQFIKLMKQSMQSLLLISLLLFATSPVFADVIDVSGDSLQALRDQGIPVIDVRREEEWRATGVLEKSHLLTFFDKQGRYDVDAWLSELHKIVKKDQPFVLICAVGGRTGTISGFLDKKLGYKNVYNVEGGIKRWIKTGGEVVPH